MSKMIVRTYRLPKSLFNKATAVAKKKGVTLSSFIRGLLKIEVGK